VARKALGKIWLLRRYALFQRLVPLSNKGKIASDRVGLDRCEIKLINLPHRVDRLDHFSDQARFLRIEQFQVFEATKRENGALGCAISHRELLASSRNNKFDLLMICEDDCEFLVARPELDALVEEFYKNDKLDVLCLGYNTPNSWQQVKISQRLSITENTQTTSCYVIKPHMISILQNSAAKSAFNLEKFNIKGIHELDLVWKELQQVYFFAIPNNRPVRQGQFYSDIEKKVTDYGV
jgi:hypothetical protein